MIPVINTIQVCRFFVVRLSAIDYKGYYKNHSHDANLSIFRFYKQATLQLFNGIKLFECFVTHSNWMNWIWKRIILRIYQSTLPIIQSSWACMWTLNKLPYPRDISKYDNSKCVGVKCNKRSLGSTYNTCAGTFIFITFFSP